MSSQLRIIVTGMLAQFPLGGVTWDYVQYLLGLRALGHDVFYLEDNGQWPYDPTSEGLGEGCKYNVEYLHATLSRWGMGERWAYCFGWKDEWHGMPDQRRREVIASADLLLNVSGTLHRPEQYRAVRRMAYLDSDPVFTQVKLLRGQQDFKKLIELHDVLFSFGELLPANLPDTGHRWLPTRQPVALDEWRCERPAGSDFRTVMTWASYNPVEFQGQQYGQKDLEFMKYLDLPRQARPAVLELAISKGKGARLPEALLRHRGFRLVDPQEVCPGPDEYRSYLQGARAEWSVQKHGYVQGQVGWFSCRSACFLAAGRPVVVQDTGFGQVLPTGLGIVAFRTPEEAAAGIADVQARYRQHAAAALAIAEEHFDARKVLAHLIERAF
jgi:hypothetical protein